MMCRIEAVAERRPLAVRREPSCKLQLKVCSMREVQHMSVRDFGLMCLTVLHHHFEHVTQAQ